MNIINLSEIIAERNKECSPEDIWEKGYSLLANLPSEDHGLILEFIMQYIVKEVEIGLGVVTTDEHIETPFFDRIDDVYRDATKDCYFCAGTNVDPREIPFTKDSVLCPQCYMKVRKFLMFRDAEKTLNTII